MGEKRRRIKPWMVVLLLGLAYVGLTLARSGGDPLGFALIGTQYSEGDPLGTPGYDGQFAYFIARDPLDGYLYCDVPAYRYQRILYPILAWVLALGSPDAAGWTLIVVNLAALTAGTWATEKLLAAKGVSPWYALAYGLYGGLVSGLRLDLTEPLSVGLIQGALLVWEQRRERTSGSELQSAAGGLLPTGVLLALAVLAKETALVAAAGLLLHLTIQRRWREAVTLGLVTVLPFAAWQGILWAWLGQPGVASGGAMATPFEMIPFRGLWQIAAISLPAFWLILSIEGPLFILPTMGALVVSVRDLLRRRFHPWVTILLMQAAILPFLPFSTWREPLAMARLASGLVAATILYGGLRRSNRILRWSLVWIATLALLINESSLPV